MHDKTKIFILDDDRYFGNFIKHGLIEHFIDVTHFQSEHECIKALHQNPDILILDHKLEHCTGLEIMTEVQRICGNNTHILYLSAQEYVHIALKALSLGAVDYLEKGNSTIKALTNSINRIQLLTNNFTLPLNIKEYRC